MFYLREGDRYLMFVSCVQTCEIRVSCNNKTISKERMNNNNHLPPVPMGHKKYNSCTYYYNKQ